MNTIKIYISIYVLLTVICNSYFVVAVQAIEVNPDTTIDTDSDGLTDYEEKAIYQTLWNKADTDEDGYLDGEEVRHGYSPWHGSGLKMNEVDTDDDGLLDSTELSFGSNILLKDSDQDGINDGEEVRLGFSPVDVNAVVLQKRIEVDVDNFKLTYYLGDIEIDSFLISSGRKNWETPRGEFSILNKVPIKHYYGHPNTPYNLEFAFAHGWKDYIHAASWHKSFGKENVSTGCVNVDTEKMKRLYEWAEVGTEVAVY